MTNVLITKNTKCFFIPASLPVPAKAGTVMKKYAGNIKSGADFSSAPYY